MIDPNSHLYGFMYLDDDTDKEEEVEDETENESEEVICLNIPSF